MAAVIVSGARGGTCDVPHTLKQLAVPGSRWRVRRSTSSPGRDAIAGWGLTSAAGGAAAWRRPVSQRRTRRPSVAKQATPGPVGGGCDSGCGDPTSWFSKKSYSCSAQVAPSSCGAVGVRRAVRHRGVDRRGNPMNMLIRKIYPACWHRRRSSTDLEIRGPNPSSFDYAVFNRCLAEQRGATPGECVSTEIAVMFHVKHDRFDYCRLVDAARARAA